MTQPRTQLVLKLHSHAIAGCFSCQLAGLVLRLIPDVDETIMRLELPSLLITDDDVDFRETLRAVFEPRFRTILASDGQEALDIVQKREVHLMLLDMHMPRLTGLETIQRVKQFKWRMPCILLSAALDEALEQQARQAEAFSVLRKPVSRRDLTSTVDAAMRRIYGWESSNDDAAE